MTTIFMPLALQTHGTHPLCLLQRLYEYSCHGKHMAHTHCASNKVCMNTVVMENTWHTPTVPPTKIVWNSCHGNYNIKKKYSLTKIIPNSAVLLLVGQQMRFFNCSFLRGSSPHIATGWSSWMVTNFVAVGQNWDATLASMTNRTLDTRTLHS